jgi:hypothetical protein
MIRSSLGPIKPICAFLPTNLHQRLQQAARQQSSTMSDLLRKALEAYLSQPAKQAGKEAA